MNATEFSELLSRLGACTEAREWAKGKSLAQVWETCERADWLLWLCNMMADQKGWPTRKQVDQAADALYSAVYAAQVSTRTKVMADIVRANLQVPL